eukprot:4640071-Ditylum_brightwellii.AAC.1
MAKAEYTSLEIRSQWDTISKPAIPKKWPADNIVALCAKLKKKDKIIKSFQSGTSSGPPGGHKSNCNAHSDSYTRSTGSSDYGPSAQVGRGKEFATKADFFSWKHTPPQDRSIYCIKMVSDGPGAPSANLVAITKLQHAGVPCPINKPSTEPTRTPMLPPQACTAKIPSRSTLPPLLQAVMMMRMRTLTQTQSTSLARSMNRIK